MSTICHFIFQNYVTKLNCYGFLRGRSRLQLELPSKQSVIGNIQVHHALDRVCSLIIAAKTHCYTWASTLHRRCSGPPIWQ